MTDLDHLIGTLSAAGAALHLDTTDLCFLIALRSRADQSVLASLEEDVLYDVYEQVCDVLGDVEAGANIRLRATHAIQRLRNQRMLARVDGGGLLGAGEYAMTRLAWSIVEHYVAEETLTRESLVLLTQALVTHTQQVFKAAQVVRREEDWKASVIDPLRVTVSDLLTGIERRQRGLDAQQEAIRAHIGGLLQRDWFDAIGASEVLLRETAGTLEELNAVLLRDCNRLHAVLAEIGGEAARHGMVDAERVASRVSDQVERVAGWGASRLKAWSDYFQFVQRYLRAVVRLDPNRAMSRKLREQLSRWDERPFYLVTAAEPALAVMREPEVKPERPSVVREARALDPTVVDVTAPYDDVPLRDRVRGLLGGRPGGLAEVVAPVLGEAPDAQRYRAVGRIAALVVEGAAVDPGVDRPWVRVSADLEIEDWAIQWED